MIKQEAVVKILVINLIIQDQYTVSTGGFENYYLSEGRGWELVYNPITKDI